MNSRSLITIGGRSLLSGASLIVALTSGVSALSALRWQRAAEPCVWISNPLGGGEWASVAWNSALTVLLGIAAAGVLVRERPARRTRAVRIGLLAVALRAVFDVALFFRLVVQGEIASSFPVPLSLGVLIVVLADVWLLRRATPPAQTRSWLTTLLSVGGVVIGQVVMIGLHVLTFGSTDYRRDADVAVVLGARVSPDGAVAGVVGSARHGGGTLSRRTRAVRVGQWCDRRGRDQRSGCDAELSARCWFARGTHPGRPRGCEHAGHREKHTPIDERATSDFGTDRQPLLSSGSLQAAVRGAGNRGRDRPSTDEPPVGPGGVLRLSRVRRILVVRVDSADASGGGAASELRFNGDPGGAVGRMHIRAELQIRVVAQMPSGDGLANYETQHAAEDDV